MFLLQIKIFQNQHLKALIHNTQYPCPIPLLVKLVFQTNYSQITNSILVLKTIYIA